MPVLTNIGVLATCCAAGAQRDVHAIEDAALAWDDGRIAWVGRRGDLPPAYRDVETIDAGGRLVIPGLIDCHTHLAFAGWRADEFEQRLLGRSYLDIARSGGGIARTVALTRAASDDQLTAACLERIDQMAALGVTTIEGKTGYGLTGEDELRLLDIYGRVARARPVGIVTTLLAAHVVPAEFAGRRSEYVDLVCSGMIPEAARRGLARFCDVFVEDTAFTADDARRIAAAARANGLGLKLHVDQFTDGGGAALAAELGAVSADHLECVSAAGVAALGRSATVAVSLPLAALYTGSRPLPARALIEAGVPVAVATDFNPGTAPSLHLPLAMTLACTLQRMTPAEALKGATIYAARAIGEDTVAGSVEPGKRADFAIIDAPDVNQWIYQFSANRCTAVYAGGSAIHRRHSGA